MFWLPVDRTNDTVPVVPPEPVQFSPAGNVGLVVEEVEMIPLLVTEASVPAIAKVDMLSVPPVTVKSPFMVSTPLAVFVPLVLANVMSQL
jgi:hypothetical protein